jgi:branched-chain amino acid transport system permease protein
MPSWEDFKPFIVTGLALGSVYAMSGVGMVVLYRATGVLNLAFGAVGAMGALIAWQLLNKNGWAEGPAFLACILFGGVITLIYGFLLGPPLAGRDPLIKATATLGLALILLGVMDLVWSDKARSMILPTSNHGFRVSDVFVNYTQVIALGFGIAITVVTGLFLRFTKLGTAMRALANDREITATLGVPVRRVEAAAWFGSGLLSGAAGLLLSNLVGLDAATLTFLVISSLAATLIGRLRSITGTFFAAIAIGLVNALVTPIVSISNYRDMTPFVLATIALLVLSTGRRGSVLSGRSA